MESDFLNRHIKNKTGFRLFVLVFFYHLKLQKEGQHSTVWAADFETPAGTALFSFFFIFFGRFDRNKQNIKFARWHLEVYHPYRSCQSTN
jgi:hypothetical protein